MDAQIERRARLRNPRQPRRAGQGPAVHLPHDGRADIQSRERKVPQLVVCGPVRRPHRLLRVLQGWGEERGLGESLEAIQPGLAERGIAAPLAIGRCMEELTLASSGPNRRNPDEFHVPRNGPVLPSGTKTARPLTRDKSLLPFPRIPSCTCCLEARGVNGEIAGERK